MVNKLANSESRKYWFLSPFSCTRPVEVLESIATAAYSSLERWWPHLRWIIHGSLRQIFARHRGRQLPRSGIDNGWLNPDSFGSSSTERTSKSYLDMFRWYTKIAIVSLLALLPVVHGIPQLKALGVHHSQTGDIRASELEIFKVQRVRVQRSDNVALCKIELAKLDVEWIGERVSASSSWLASSSKNVVNMSLP